MEKQSDHVRPLSLKGDHSKLQLILITCSIYKVSTNTELANTETSARNVCMRDSNFSPLCMFVNDCKSATSMDFGVTSSFYQVGEIYK